ncbi:MAG: glycosyltransferase, partial [Actinomycetota bacterium]|nr:glycosyltransferase [Actinomycetota bacterium]
MRILVVSAHFPPNFMSGGTLAPQRLARGLRARGHEVGVYAGWLGEGRRPLDTWTEADSTGLAVRWVATTPWVEWGHRYNHDNPRVAEDFGRHLAEVRPELVHFHALQSLGAGLVDVAADAGAKVVLTMHDYWWWCGRQFFVTRAFQPCPPVVTCGACPCEVDRAWLEERGRRLRGSLARADVVLAVSRSSAEVLAANGVDPAKLRVDENGVPDAERPPVAAGNGGHGGTGSELRLTYAGGPHRMKGVHVVLDAARRLAGRPGWRLTAYGAERFVHDQSLDLSGLPVELRPSFEEAEADDVFAGTDVLVVPSVMLESHSLITREALSRRVPVVCTDTMGPEEVVRHGGNGLVVPAGDPAALAAALARLLDEPGLLPRLRSGCRSVPLRSVTEQVTELEGLYRQLLSGAGGPPGPALRPRRLRHVGSVLFVVGIEGAPLRYRARLPAEALGLLGVRTEVRHYRDPNLARLAEGADAVVVYRVPATVQVLDLIAAVRRRGTPVFFDVDDLIFDPGLEAEIPALAVLAPDERALWLDGVHRYRTTMEACDVFIGSTDELCRHAEEVVGLPAARFANGVGMLVAQASDLALGRDRRPGPLRVGYLSGTNTHDEDWMHVEPAVVALLEARPGVELWLVGLVEPSAALAAFDDRVRRIPFRPWQELPGVLRDLDVNLAPLEAGRRFNQAKSAIKWLEAALTATPTIASPTAPFRQAVRHGENGLLAATTAEWDAALRTLVDDDDLRRRLGRRARRDALLEWSPHRQGYRYLEILEAEPRRPRRPSTGWTPVAHDEPLAPTPLEAYRLGASPVIPPARRRVPGLA